MKKKIVAFMKKKLQESALLSEFRVDKDIPEYTQGAETM